MDIHKLIDRLEDEENAVLRRSFLAPVVRGGSVGVRIQGVVCRFTPQDRRFEGWGVFRPVSLDAVRLELTVGPETADPVSELVHGRVDPRSEEEGVARLYVNAEEAEVRMTFLRSFSLKRFLDANREQMEGLAEAGLLTDREIRRLIAENEERFAVLEADGIRDGDRLEHEVHGDTVTTRYTDVTGAIRIDEVQVGAEQRTMLMGSLFGPQSSFRNGLLDLVFSRSLSTP